MQNYYYYLWRTTWPDAVVLFLIFIFITIRISIKIIRTVRKNPSRWSVVGLSFKIIIWSLVLVVYILMFVRLHEDWILPPGVWQGKVVGKVYDGLRNEYILEVRSDSLVKEFQIDPGAYDKIEVGSMVRIMYLIHQAEVVRCEVLTK